MCSRKTYCYCETETCSREVVVRSTGESLDQIVKIKRLEKEALEREIHRLTNLLSATQTKLVETEEIIEKLSR